MPLTKFCASYSKGFAAKVTSWMMKSMDQAYVGEHEDMPPAKRCRFSIPPAKRLKSTHAIYLDEAMPEPNEPIDLDPDDQHMEPVAVPEVVPQMPYVNPGAPISSPVVRQAQPVASPNLPKPALVRDHSPESELWQEIFRTMETMAPRVANLQVDMSHAVAQQVQQLVPTMQVHVILVCRGTERYQLPLLLSERHVNIMRHTVCMHRTTGEIHDLGCEDWYALKRQQRIRPAMPSKLMITSFGHPLHSEDHSP